MCYLFALFTRSSAALLHTRIVVCASSWLLWNCVNNKVCGVCVCTDGVCIRRFGPDSARIISAPKGSSSNIGIAICEYIEWFESILYYVVVCSDVGSWRERHSIYYKFSVSALLSMVVRTMRIMSAWSALAGGELFSCHLYMRSAAMHFASIVADYLCKHSHKAERIRPLYCSNYMHSPK